MPDKKKPKGSLRKQKYFLDTQNTKRKFISRHDKHLREKLWISDFDGTLLSTKVHRPEIFYVPNRK